MQQLESQGIRLCGITDYNGVRSDWFHVIRELGAARHIEVLPGAELSVRAGRGLEAQGAQTAIKTRRSIDGAETLEAIEALMEGDEEAFRRRAEKYRIGRA